jgi:putative peptidoglycan lipid II flippase
MQPSDKGLRRRIGDRDAALRRLRTTTALVAAGTLALAGAFGGLAAKAFPGRSGKTRSAIAPTTPVRPAVAAASSASTPPPLVPAAAAAPEQPPSQSAPAAQPAAPVPPPVETQVPPVAVSGGS